MPDARRREIRRWRERRAHRRRRVRLVGTAGALVVAMALILAVAPGAHAPTDRATLVAATGDLVDRVRDAASRSGERAPEPAEPTPEPATSSAPPEAAAPDAPPAPQDAPAPTGAPSPAPQAAAQPAAPAPAPEAAPAPASADPGAAMSAQIVTLTNAERAAVGLPALAVSGCATDQAAARASLLVAEGRFEHDPLGPVLQACAAGTVGENLSLGYATAQAAVTGWMNSQGHRENLLRTSFSQIGVACVSGQRGWLCAQVFLG